MCSVRLKTVYDATRHDPTGLLAAQLCLHVVSWRAEAHSAAGLSVTCIGAPSPSLADFLESHGADLEVRDRPHRLVHRSPIYNKHLAIPTDETERVFLSDNDTVYMGDVHLLAAVPEQSVAASLSDLRRVTPNLWEELRNDAGVQVLPMDWIPWKEWAMSERDARPAVRERYAYFNGGAILFPRGTGFWRLWEVETERLSAYLESRGLDDRKDAGSDQLSLVAAAARHGSWQLLPPSFNVRPFHFRIRELALEHVAQLHLVNTGRALRSLAAGASVPLSKLLRRYWDLMIFPEIDPAKEPLAASLLEQILHLVAEHDLDTLRWAKLTT